MVDIDDNNFALVRKNLNTFSILILILAFTNAKIDVASFLGVQIQLNGQKFYIALFIIYSYLTWRYLTKLPLRGGFWNDFTGYYLASYGGDNKDKLFSKHRAGFVTDPKEHIQIIEQGEYSSLLTMNAHRLGNRDLLHLRLVATFYITKEIEGMRPGNNLSAQCDIVVARTTFIRRLLIFCLKYDKFGDYLFPIIPIGINFMFFVTKSTWQGSLQSLIA